MINIIPQLAKNHAILLLFFCVPFLGAAHNSDLIHLDEHLKLFLPGDDIQQQTARDFARQELQQFLTDLENQRVRKKSKTKAIRIITDLTYHRFFKNHSTYSTFSSLFKSGQYNATTCAALYAMIFEYFDLPYSLVLQKKHVTFWADPIDKPQELSAFARPTEDGEVSFNQFIESYHQLLETIGHPSAQSKSGAALYWQHFFGEGKNLNLKELASYLCFQNALEDYQKGAHPSALTWLDEAEFLSRQPLYHVLRKSIWLQQAVSENEQSVVRIWQLWNENHSSLWSTELLAGFSNTCLTFTNPVTGSASIDSLYHIFNKNFEGHTALQGQLKLLYFSEQARFFGQQNRAARVMDFMDSLYLLNPHQEEVQNVLAGMLVWSLRSERRFEQGLERINYYAQRYPFLNENSHFQDQHMFYLAEKTRYYFDREDFETGFTFFHNFKLLVERHADAPRLVNWVSTAYLSVSNYYFRKSNYRSCLLYLKEANDITPKDPYLEHRIDLIENYYLR